MLAKVDFFGLKLVVLFTESRFSITGDTAGTISHPETTKKIHT